MEIISFDIISSIVEYLPVKSIDALLVNKTISYLLSRYWKKTVEKKLRARIDISSPNVWRSFNDFIDKYWSTKKSLIINLETVAVNVVTEGKPEFLKLILGS